MFKRILYLWCAWLSVSEAAFSATFVVNTTSDNGAGSLRQAILNANLNPGQDLISFDLPGSVFLIQPLSPLPAITESVIMDGTTQPGFGGRPIVELSGANAGTPADGLLLRCNSCVVRGLVINRFSGDGIRVEGGGSHFLGLNYLGTDLSGTLAQGNGGSGITFIDSGNNTIGGTQNGNVISGRNGHGIFFIGFDCQFNHVEGNLIGTDVSGMLDLGNAGNGVVISDGADNVVGGPLTAQRNIISGNDQSGVYLLGSATRNVLAGNYIGTDISGRAALSNSADGVTINSGKGNTVGGLRAGSGNLIAGNGQRGVYLFGNNPARNLILGNYIGTDGAGGARVPNRASGIGISGGSSNVVGGTLAAAANIISGNEQSGVALDGNSISNVVQGNLIGIDVTGQFAIGNGFSGVTIASAQGNTIGGAAAGSGNIISGNFQNGVLITEAAATNNVVAGNFMGVDLGGHTAISNVFAGVRLESGPNVIGGFSGGERNLISGNGQSGVYLFGPAASFNRVAGNYIGVDVSGRARIPNGIAGVGISGGSSNVIGGAGWRTRNVISANQDSGIYILGSTSSNNVVSGNYVGTDCYGTNALGNAVDGISIYDSANNVVGGVAPGAGNLVSANDINGIYLTHPNATGNIVQGNFVGTAFNGTSPLGNRTHAILLEDSASNNLVGGDTATSGNRIGFTVLEGYDGVRIKSGVGNRVRRNSIFKTNGLGIDLGIDGVTLNDLGDADEGANRLQNFPVLNSVVGRQHVATVSGSLNSLPGRVYTIDLYGNSRTNLSGNGEGEEWIGSVDVTTGVGGNAGFSITITNLVPIGAFVTATATDAQGNTSEFSRASPAPASLDTDGDGLPDDYESARGLNPTDARDGAQDRDGDGATNLQEFRAGTDPNDGASVFRIMAVGVGPGVGYVSFNSVRGKEYRVEAAPGALGPWRTVADQVAGTGNILEVMDDAPSSPSGFYRVLVQ